VRLWKVGYSTFSEWVKSYAHLAVPTPAWEMVVHEEEVGYGGSSMMSLLQVVEDDMKMQLGPPPQLTWPKNQEPFVPISYPPKPEMEYRAPLLPRPTMMPLDPMANGGFVPRHFIPPLRPAPPTLPPLRLDSKDSHATLTVPPMETNPPTVPSQQMELHPQGSIPQTSAPLLRKPSIDPLLSSAHIPEYPQHSITPKPIAPRPKSVTTSIQPSPASSKPSRPSSSSPDILRKQRLLPKTLPPPPTHTPPPREEDRPAHERFPLQWLNERAATDSPSIFPSTCAAAPPPAPRMGRFGSSGGRQETAGQSHPVNAKVAIPRHYEGSGPLRIAPAPAKKVTVDPWAMRSNPTDGSVATDESVKSADVAGEMSSEKVHSEKGKERKGGTEGEGEINKEAGRPGLRSRKRHV
jgi:hypothetical protein